jgi:dsDNA-binding SOS-regulon protein
LQPQYRDPKDYVKNLRQLYADGKLSPKLTEIYFGQRPAEEFHDVRNDPSQLTNLVGNSKFSQELDRHRKLLDDWLAKGDAGEGEESHEEKSLIAARHADALMRLLCERTDTEIQVHVSTETLVDSDPDGCSQLRNGPNLAPHTVRRL